MRVGLFIPCYIDQFYPQVGVATLKLLEQLGCEVEYPLDQTCCGQPLANAGYEAKAVDSCPNFIHLFKDFDYVVAPSGSCIYHVKHHWLTQTDSDSIRNKIYELSEFIIDILEKDQVNSIFQRKVGIHESCHGLRGLRLGTSSELSIKPFNKAKQLLEKVDGIELVELNRKDECCGLGGTFSVTEEAVSVKMGRDRLRDHLDHDVDVITSTDMSCLMHLEGLIRREKLPIEVMHFLKS